MNEPTATFARLNNWAVVTKVDPYTPPELQATRLSGIVTGHRTQPDGKEVTTSPVVGKRGQLVVTRSGSEYELGDTHPDYEAQFPDARNRLLQTLPSA